MQSHWADQYAERVIRTHGDRDTFTCASGITPSGTVHIGNFREIISVELVVRALSQKGKQVRFVYSWDDFDVFRKVPTNIPNSQEYEPYLRMPISEIPDPFERAESFALGNEQAIEYLLSQFGIYPEYIYQTKEYKKGAYSEGIRKALEHRDTIRTILDEYRTQPLDNNWWPITLFSAFTNKDTTTILEWDGEWNITYRCEETQNTDTIDIRSSGLVKLLWRIDWPMRWDYEQVIFEPAGKDHHSQGGSFDTARDIVSQVYGYQAPITFQYGFVSVKGGSGKLSSSSGEVVGLEDMLAVYQPEIIRYLFASTKPQSEFAVSFDLDVIKVYEDYDKCERICYGLEQVKEERKVKESRIYELSQVARMTDTMPIQVPFRHLCNLLQIHRGDYNSVTTLLEQEFGVSAIQTHYSRIQTRMTCAWNWITHYAPEDFKFSLRAEEELASLKEDTHIAQAISLLYNRLQVSWDTITDKDINSFIYDVARECELEVQELFTALYMRLIGKQKGPRLGSFMYLLGKEVVNTYLSIYNESVKE